MANSKDGDELEEVERDSKRVCASCIGEKFLRAEVRRKGMSASCSYCKSKRDKTISTGELAGYVDGAFERHYFRTPEEATGIEAMLLKEGGSWDRDGEPAKYAIADAAEIDEEIAEDVRAILEELHYDHDLAQMSQEGEFDEDSYYAESDADDSRFQASWFDFENSLQTEARLFNPNAEGVLDEIFEGVHTHFTRAGRKVVVEAGPGKRLNALYRARVFQWDSKLEEALKRPDLQLGPPPAEISAAGRMNARGIAIFYGATHPNVALAETRPPVGSRVLIGRFEILRPLRLLDVEALRSVYIEGSIFDPGFIQQLEKAKFLKTLSARITQPVMPEHQPFEYVVTQAIADYLASRTDPSLDGIIYPSVQVGQRKKNVALFHKASRVVPLDIPEKTEIRVWLTQTDEDGTAPDYSVWEETPPPEPETIKKGGPSIRPPAMERVSGDQREPVLKIDTGSVYVHHVERVTFTAFKFAVRRSRSVRSRSPVEF